MWFRKTEIRSITIVRTSIINKLISREKIYDWHHLHDKQNETHIDHHKRLIYIYFGTFVEWFDVVTPMINVEIRRPSPAYDQLRESSGDFPALETEIISLNYGKLRGKVTNLLFRRFKLADFEQSNMAGGYKHTPSCGWALLCISLKCLVSSSISV